MNAVTVSAVGWLVILAAAITWETLGLLGVGGLWPLTWLVRDALHKHEAVTGLGIMLACVGFPAWLLWHFLVEKRRFGRKP